MLERAGRRGESSFRRVVAILMLFDTHTHLDQSEFDDVREAVVRRAVEAGVHQLVAVGVTAESSRRCVALAAEFSEVYAAVAIHPNYVAAAEAGDWDAVVALAAAPRVVAIGETGLDRHWDYTPLDQQQEMFARHLRLADECDLPFIVHMRDCEADILAALRAERERRGRPLRGIMHSFTGDAALAGACLDLGLHISFAGMLTYKKNQTLRECAATIPADRLLVETDCPYLSPEPVRGTRPNEPALVRHTAARLAEARGTTLDEIGALTTSNARRLFRVDG